jgi:hypothetical protein
VLGYRDVGYRVGFGDIIVWIVVVHVGFGDIIVLISVVHDAELKWNKSKGWRNSKGRSRQDKGRYQRR